ncbi:MAG: hypothetical protein KatS3mg109_1129 [Pirellulaceae bacterium]|nr:MAG: hypothetical protein KatS3mg109_1129 [Pirellulaceae bacterium]
MSESRDAFLRALVTQFHADLGVVGEFTPVGASQMPDVYKQLLAHREHMTVTVEAFYGSLVDVQVLQKRRDDHFYAREILLRRQPDSRVVQYGIVRLDWNMLDDEVRRDILTERIPLGRTLIEHNVLREVEVLQLWRVGCGRRLAELFAVEPGAATFGRTAIIHCNGHPAIELLEIVAPVTLRDAPNATGPRFV